MSGCCAFGDERLKIQAIPQNSQTKTQNAKIYDLTDGLMILRRVQRTASAKDIPDLFKKRLVIEFRIFYLGKLFKQFPLFL